MLARKRIVALCIALCPCVPAAEAANLRAKVGGATSGPCTTWATACSLSHAISQALPGQDQVWVQAGTYGPIELRNGVKIIGGFAGTETTALQSNHTVNVTIIDGGAATQCVLDDPNTTGNSTLLRGFTIRNGYDSGNEGGGGMFLQNSSALIAYCTFENNRAVYFGGALAVRGSGSPQFINCIFRNNGEGGASDTIGGGAAFIERSSPTFVNCLFHGNVAEEAGAVLVAYGTPTFINCTIVNNQSTVSYAGGVADQEGRAFFKNCILWGNTAAKQNARTGQIFSGAGGASTAVYTNVQGGWPGTNMLSLDPQFNNAAAFDFSLQSASPCKDVGDSLLLPSDAADLNWNNDTGEFVPKDLNRLARVSGTIVDLGAYEYSTMGGGGGGGE